MNQAEINNMTPFADAALFVANEEYRPIVVPILKATYEIEAGGALNLAAEQPAVDFVGVHNGEPGSSSLRYEPETAFAKPCTDTALVGHAYPRQVGDCSTEVLFRIGPIRRQARVSGERSWRRGRVGIKASRPEPFESIPLTWERAFGGWDRSAENPSRHSYEGRNPVGVGFRGRRAPFEEGALLPNIEDPAQPQDSYFGRAVPVGFGFICPDWQPRRALGGTYGAAWEEERMPLLPQDFCPSFFNAAAPGLVAKGYLCGDEPVLILGATRSGRLRFDLPGVPPPSCNISLRCGKKESFNLNLDTVVVDTDAMRLTLLWRQGYALRREPHEVRAIEIQAGSIERGK